MARKENNIFYIDESYIHRMRTRIMAIEIDGNIISPELYLMKGPRTIVLLKELSPDTKVYGYIMNAKIGNRFFSNIK